MVEIANMNSFRKAKILALEIEWLSLIDRAIEFEKQGKMVFHHQLVDKAKVVRAEITKLRKSITKKKPEVCGPISPQTPNITVSFEPFIWLSHDIGYPKTPEITPDC
jgi:hypothetical protein